VPPSHVRRLGRRRDHLNLAGPLPRPVVGERVDDRLGAAGTPDINLVLLGPTDDPGRLQHGPGAASLGEAVLADLRTATEVGPM
jgi:hypothetical protein